MYVVPVSSRSLFAIAVPCCSSLVARTLSFLIPLLLVPQYWFLNSFKRYGDRCRELLVTYYICKTSLSSLLVKSIN